MARKQPSGQWRRRFRTETQSQNFAKKQQSCRKKTRRTVIPVPESICFGWLTILHCLNMKLLCCSFLAWPGCQEAIQFYISQTTPTIPPFPTSRMHTELACGKNQFREREARCVYFIGGCTGFPPSFNTSRGGANPGLRSPVVLQHLRSLQLLLLMKKVVEATSGLTICTTSKFKKQHPRSQPTWPDAERVLLFRMITILIEFITKHQERERGNCSLRLISYSTEQRIGSVCLWYMRSILVGR